MVRATSERVGRGECPNCAAPVTYRRSAGGYLTHKCEACDSSGFAEPGGAAHALRMATIKAPAAAPAAAPEAAPAAAPEAKAKGARKAFDLGAL